MTGAHAPRRKFSGYNESSRCVGQLLRTRRELWHASSIGRGPRQQPTGNPQITRHCGQHSREVEVSFLSSPEQLDIEWHSGDHGTGAYPPHHPSIKHPSAPVKHHNKDRHGVIVLDGGETSSPRPTLDRRIALSGFTL